MYKSMNSNSMMDQCVNAHNYYRCLHGVNALVFDAKLAASAQMYAKKMAEADVTMETLMAKMLKMSHDNDMMMMMYGSYMMNKNMMEGTNMMNENMMEETNMMKKNMMEETNKMNENMMEETNMMNENMMEGTNKINKSMMEGTNMMNGNMMKGTNMMKGNMMKGTNMMNENMIEGTNMMNENMMEETNIDMSAEGPIKMKQNMKVNEMMVGKGMQEKLNNNSRSSMYQMIESG